MKVPKCPNVEKCMQNLLCKHQYYLTRMYRLIVISAIKLSSIAALIMIVFLTANIIEHKSEGNGPYPNLSMYKLKMVKFKKIIFQHVDVC